MATKKTQTQTKIDLDLNNIFKAKADQPVAKHTKAKAKPEAEPKTKPQQKIKTASFAKTLDATSKIRPTRAMLDMMDRILDIELDADLPSYEASCKVEVRPVQVPIEREIFGGVEPQPPDLVPAVKVNTTTLATVAEHALRTAGYLVPDFHQVAALPGNIKDQIRQLGRSLFKSMTTTPTNKIYVVANLGGMGPNTNREVQSIANWIRENGEDYGDGSINFDRSIPGYSAETHLYTAAGIAWLLVDDFAGQYIYAWPENESLFKIAVSKIKYKLN